MVATPHCSPIPLGSPRGQLLVVSRAGMWAISAHGAEGVTTACRCLGGSHRHAQTCTLSLELGRVPLVCGLAPGTSR